MTNPKNLILLVIVAVLGVGGYIVSKSDGGAAKLIQSVTSSRTLETSLVARVPQDVVGFLGWDAQGSAYAKLTKSPWAGSENLGIADTPDILVKTVEAVLKKHDLSLSKRKNLEKLFSHGAAFVRPEAEGSEGEYGFGAVFESDDSVPLETILTELRAAIQESGTQVSDLTLETGSGMKVIKQLKTPALTGVPGAAATNATVDELFVGWNGNLGVIASRESLVAEVLGSAADTLPTIINSDSFKGATKELPDYAKRFVFGYAELGQVPSPDGSPSPFEDLTFSLAMDKTPESDFRLRYKATEDAPNPIGQFLQVSSSSGISKSVSGNPMVFLSLDGATLAMGKTFAAMANPQLASQLAVLDSIKRLGITLGVAPVGQSIFPVPDVLLSAEVEDSAAAKATLLSSLSQASFLSGLQMPAPGAAPDAAAVTWQEKEVSGQAVSYMITSMGVGLYITAKDNLLLASSTEAQIERTLAGVDIIDGQIVSKLSSRGQGLLSASNSVSDFYFNFDQFGSFLENMGGLLQMYAPQNEGAKKLVEAENIASLKKMGVILGALTHETGEIRFRTFYEPPATS